MMKDSKKTLMICRSEEEEWWAEQDRIQRKMERLRRWTTYLFMMALAVASLYAFMFFFVIRWGERRYDHWQETINNVKYNLNDK